jgi:hypothetical protein
MATPDELGPDLVRKNLRDVEIRRLIGERRNADDLDVVGLPGLLAQDVAPGCRYLFAITALCAVLGRCR